MPCWNTGEKPDTGAWDWNRVPETVTTMLKIPERRPEKTQMAVMSHRNSDSGVLFRDTWYHCTVLRRLFRYHTGLRIPEWCTRMASVFRVYSSPVNRCLNHMKGVEIHQQSILWKWRCIPKKDVGSMDQGTKKRRTTPDVMQKWFCHSTYTSWPWKCQT